ncbi:MAG: hypothetical protein LBN00_01695 [Oscillospiraceae bacterium]|jgi:hypothetical protein|nr:hypothetical protein [Oscillospiraceae bacterium]
MEITVVFLAIIFADLMFTGLMIFAVALDRRIARLENRTAASLPEAAAETGATDLNAAMAALMSYGAKISGEETE